MSREIKWFDGSLDDFKTLPEGVRKQFNTKLQYLRAGQAISGLKSWSGIGAGGRELASSGFRLVLTIEFPDAVWVLHTFKKDASRGKKTRPRHTELVSRRYRGLNAEYAARSRKQ
jgi:phage-related protein